MKSLFKPLHSTLKRFLLTAMQKNRILAYLLKEDILFKSFIEEIFDHESYLKNNPDVKSAGVDPVEHWLNYGMKEGRLISPFISFRYKPSADYVKRPGWRHFTWKGSSVVVRVSKTRPDIMKFSQYDEIAILTTKHCIYVAELIQQNLKKINVNSSIINECPQKGFKKVLHFVICPQMFLNLPEVYIAFQMEQTVSSRWFSEKYFEILANSCAIFDYSLSNVEFMQKHGLDMQQIYYMPIDYLKDYDMKNDTLEKNYDVLFYGDIKNERRKSFINIIREHYSVKVIADLFGEDLLKEIKKAKVLINIHYYEDALLETTRIYECLSLNSCIIISEKSRDFSEHKHLENVVDFVDINNVDSMIQRIDFWLQNDKIRKEKLEYNKLFLNNKENLFEFYFFRFLLAIDNVDFDAFYRLTGNNIKFNSNEICLGLPESVERKKAFDKDNKFGFDYFPGLRNTIGWIGCGLSYKFIMRKAMEQKINQIVVCEDDVLFFEDFHERFMNISKYLVENNRDWHLFSGLIADLGNVEVQKIVNYDKEKLIYINKMVSTVFNIYNQSFYPYVLKWDEKNKDPNVNTIDRFLEKQENLTIVTTNPFLVGHKEDLHSTLWGFKNTTYKGLIQKSNDLLKDKITEYCREN